MPVMDGLAATPGDTRMGKSNGRKPAPIIALTAAALKGDREICVAGGMHGLSDQADQAGCPASGHQGAFIGDFTSVGRDCPSDKPCYSGDEPKDCWAGAQIPGRFQAERRCRARGGGTGDFEAAGFLGHGMRGAGGMYGFQAITDIGAALEQAADNGDAAAMRKSVAELMVYLDRMEITLGPKPFRRDARTRVRQTVTTT